MKARMRWNCQSDGCFFDKKVVRLYDFDDCFGGKIGLTDVDGLVERNGHFLFVEWKAPQEKLPMGQRILFEQLTKLSDKIVVVVVNGHSSQSEGSHPVQYQTAYKGRWSAVEETNIEQLRDFFRRWYTWADNQGEFQWHT